MFIILILFFSIFIVVTMMFYFFRKKIRWIQRQSDILQRTIRKERDLDRLEKISLLKEKKWEEKNQVLFCLHEMIHKISALNLIDHKIKELTEILPQLIEAEKFFILLKIDHQSSTYPYNFFMNFSKELSSSSPRTLPNEIESLYLSYLSHVDLSQSEGIWGGKNKLEDYFKHYFDKYEIKNFYVLPILKEKEYGCVIIQNPDDESFHLIKPFLSLISCVFSLGLYIREHEIKQNHHYFVVNNQLLDNQTCFVSYNYFLELSEKEMERHKSLNQSLSLVKLRINFNDKDHKDRLEQEIILEKFHMVLRQTLRETDLISYFKDVFFCLLLETDPIHLYVVKERIDKQIHLSFSQDDLKSFDIGWVASSFPEKSSSLEDLISSVVHS